MGWFKFPHGKVKLTKWAKALLGVLADMDESDAEVRRVGAWPDIVMFRAGIVPIGNGAWVDNIDPSEVLHELERGGFALKTRNRDGDRLILTNKGQRQARPWYYPSIRLVRSHGLAFLIGVMSLTGAGLLTAWLMKILWDS